MRSNTIVLASASPARKALLEASGFDVITCPTGCDESHNLTRPDRVVYELAFRKLDAYMHSPSFKPDVPALACDTLLWFEGRLIGKARSEEEARAQLTALSGRTHSVYSGFALYLPPHVHRGFESTAVTFKVITRKMLDEYIASGQWKGAAGSYRIGGDADKFIEKTEGNTSTVVGLPLEAISDIIKGTASQNFLR